MRDGIEVDSIFQKAMRRVDCIVPERDDAERMPIRLKRVCVQGRMTPLLGKNQGKHFFNVMEPEMLTAGHGDVPTFQIRLDHCAMGLTSSGRRCADFQYIRDNKSSSGKKAGTEYCSPST